MKDIDLVVLWVDGNDPKWQEEKNKYIKSKNINSFFWQDWNWMRYWFRCVEENMPWIRYIFFVTFGHTPSWLNLNHPKLKIINHKDFMPLEFLPTFNSNTINANIFRIKELSEKFIYSDDDIFFIGKQKLEDFFTEEGLPKDFLRISPITENYGLSEHTHLMLNNMLIIKKHFSMQNIIDNGEEKYLSKEYPLEVIEDNKKLINIKYIPGFKETHMAYSFLKSSFEKLWKEEEYALFSSSMHKFRTITDLTITLYRDYQLASGNFSPFYPSGRIYCDTYSPNLEELILSKDTNMLCINESQDKTYTKERADEICSYFEKRFPKHSSFELD